MSLRFAELSVPFSAATVLYHSDLTVLRSTLQSLKLAVLSLGEVVPLTVVDQSLNEDYSAAARALCESVVFESTLELRFITAERNGGYGAGHNLALCETLGNFHLILNPDVELEPSALIVAITTLTQHTNIVLLAPRGQNDRDQEEYLAKRYPTLWVLMLRAFGSASLKHRFERQLARYELRDLSDEPGPQDVPLVSGCCMVVRGAALRDVQGFDEHFFMYFEDYDLSLRLAKLGRVVREPRMRIVHHGGNTAGKGLRHIMLFAGGAIRFFSRWGWRLF